MSRYDFNKKIILVTGGTKGIGRATAMTLLKSNARVVVCYGADEESARKTEIIFRQNGFVDFLILKKDISERQNIRDLLAMIKKSLGNDPEFLVNNAGILKQGDFFSLTDEQWDKTLKVNLRGPFMLCQECLTLMKETGGAIVNLSSIGGQIGGDRAPDYAASKAALICLTKSMARIGSKFKVRVNAVAPGWIETPIFEKTRLEELKIEAKEKILLGRLGQPEEVASAIAFLLSDDASFITGQVLNINGGMYLG